MNKRLFLVVGGIILLLFIIALSYFSFQYFRNKDVIVNTIEIVVDDDGNKVNMEKQVPTNNEDISSINPYNFYVKNTGEHKVEYQLLIEDNLENNTKKILSRRNLRYELSMNGKVIKRDDLSNIKNNIIDVNTVSVGKKNAYALKVWIIGNVESSEWMNKYYSYNIYVNPISK